ncbi:hypothetical protein IKG07_00700 [Candidatus Saccharibacteria bacterium]|nr:hypothetical protein [Candidatus Saccharibacteria bacterium]
MNKTHKRILGFAGLGLVAAITTVAAGIPTPAANAVSSFTDIIQVKIENEESTFELTSEAPSVITAPSYEFRAGWENVGQIEITLVNKDDEGNIIFGPVTIWNGDGQWLPGDRTFDLNLEDYGGYGNFTITGVGEGFGSVPIERILTVRYEAPVEDVDVDENGDGYATVDDVTAEVKEIKTEIYDEDGNLVRTIITGTDPDGKTDVYDKDGHLIISIPGGYDPTDGKVLIYMGGLPAGTYTGEITYWDDQGDQVGRPKYIKIKWGGDKEPIVPDTGGLFKGLNISREDYLITGAVVFMIIGVVAFGVVKRNRSNKK